MSPNHSRAFWALFIVANLWLATGVPSLAAVFAIAAVITRYWSALDRRFDIPPRRGDLEP